MNILIVGCGLLGRKAAQMLDNVGHAVAVLDNSADRLSLLDPDFSGVTHLGFPMDIQALRAAGIEGCDAVAVVTADDNLNIAAGQIAKSFFHVSNVLIRISDPQREDAFENLGLQVICPTNTAGAELVTALTSPRQSRQVTLGISTVSLLVIPVEKRLYGRTTDDLEPRPGDGILGVLQENGHFQLLERDRPLPLAPGDCVVYSRKID